MRSVSEASETGPEVPAAGTRKVSKPDARGVRIGGPVPTQRGHEGAHQAIGTPPPPAAIGDLTGDRVPSEKVASVRRQLDAAAQKSPVGTTHRLRSSPADRWMRGPLRRRIERGWRRCARREGSSQRLRRRSACSLQSGRCAAVGSGAAEQHCRCSSEHDDGAHRGDSHRPRS